MSTLKEQIIEYCTSQLGDESTVRWFTDKLTTLDSPPKFFLAFGMVSRKVEKLPLALPKNLQQALCEKNTGFSPELWTLDEFCRLAFLLKLPTSTNHNTIETLLASADMREQVAIYKSLCFLENAEAFVLNAIDGIRTNMIDVFDAIALNNGFARKHFSEDPWNQMVLKAIFMERPIFRIDGLDERKNEKLAGILHDFAHERWAAGRLVTPELWRMMPGFVNDSIATDLKKVIDSDTPTAKKAAIKALAQSDHPGAAEWLTDEGLSEPNISWNEIGHEVWSAAHQQ